MRPKYVQMDVNQRYSIAYKELKSGLHEFQFVLDGSLFQAFESTDIKDGNLTAQVSLLKMEYEMNLDITIDGTVRVTCDRCLEDFDLPIHFDGKLIVRITNEVGEYDGEVMWVLPAEDEINMAQYLYESVVLSLPYSRVHPEGKCNPDMLKRFNIVTEQEFAAIEEKAQENDVQSPFKDLEALRNQMEKDEQQEK